MLLLPRDLESFVPDLTFFTNISYRQKSIVEEGGIPVSLSTHFVQAGKILENAGNNKLKGRSRKGRSEKVDPAKKVI